MCSGPHVPINSATRPIGIGFVAELVRARRLGRARQPRLLEIPAVHRADRAPELDEHAVARGAARIGRPRRPDVERLLAAVIAEREESLADGASPRLKQIAGAAG